MASTTQTIKLTSSDGQTFQLFLKKANMLKQMLNDLGFEEDGIYPEEGIPCLRSRERLLERFSSGSRSTRMRSPGARGAPDAPLQPKRRQGGQRALRHLRASTEAGGCDQRGLLPRDAGLDRLADKYTANNLKKRGGEDGRVARDSSEEGRRTSGRRRRKTTKREDRLKKEDAIEHFLTSD
ncbi:hypothetical protein L596_029363 [Steinernema carpocapsae]|uniref:SKP1 component POZ domain-containing protein n=1 Tax=Steinernema carpocapsae TaxID=34508 RepID=A0A4U5LUF3_STECR|nr:hypothetical protein L596_029363 [Steinernema carpocapsae]